MLQPYVFSDYVKCMYGAPCYMVNGIDFICGKYMFIHLPYNATKYVTYMPNLVSIFVSGIYMAITCEVHIESSCVLGTCM